MKNWILINDRKFEIICHQNSNSKFIRAFTTYSDLPYEIDPNSYITSKYKKLRILIRFEDLELPIWKPNTKIIFFIKINRTHLSGNFITHSIKGVSGFKDGRIVDLVVTDLNQINAPLTEIREVQFSDLLS